VVSHECPWKTYQSLPFEQMTGDIPNEIYSLTALNSLNLGNDIARGNAFHGTFPRDFSFTTLGASRRILANHCSIKTSPTFHLSRAENLHLHNIHLSGTISSNIGRLTNLSEFLEPFAAFVVLPVLLTCCYCVISIPCR
jgi:hypothetical protein